MISLKWHRTRLIEALLKSMKEKPVNHIWTLREMLKEINKHPGNKKLFHLNQVVSILKGQHKIRYFKGTAHAGVSTQYILIAKKIRKKKIVGF